MKESAVNLFNLLLEIAGNLGPFFFLNQGLCSYVFLGNFAGNGTKRYKAFFIGATINFVFFFFSSGIFDYFLYVNL